MRFLPLVFLLFFGSGATALVYEVVWSKYLALMFGSTIQAQSVVLAVFMGGLALGNRIFGGRADLLRRPVAMYGWIEIAIGIYALSFPFLFHLGDRLFLTFGPPLLGKSLPLLLLKGTLSLLLLIAPTILMGGTLPLMAAWLRQDSAEAGRRTALFYAVNSIGAVAGAGLAGFVLVKTLGLVTTLFVTAGVNLLIGGMALHLARKGASKQQPASSSARADAVPQPLSTDEAVLPQTGLGLVGLLVFFSGGCSLGLEILTARSLSLIFGASLQAFSTMLMAFILGIGIGSTIIASPRLTRFLKPDLTPWLLLGAAAWIGFFLVTIEPWAIAYVGLRNALGGERYGYYAHLLLSGGISLVLLGVPAALLGAVLPLWIRLISAHSPQLGRQVGRLLTWNTLGAVTGSIVAGFLMMPVLGLHGSLIAVAILLALTAVVLTWRLRQIPATIAASGCAVALFLVAYGGQSSWQRVVTSGLFRWRDFHLTWSTLKEEAEIYQTLFYEDAPDASVTVEGPPEPVEDPELILSINGKPDASTHRDLSTQYLLAHLPMMMRPDATEVFVLGMGSGITAGALLGHPVRQVVIAENCEPILRAAEFFEPWNRGVLTNPRTKIFREDARTVLKLSPARYDVIISEPSNPWVAGVGSVFTHEFYELAASRLEEGGIMAQWFHMYEMEDQIVWLVLRTFHSVFPHFEIWESQSGDLILLGSKTAWESTPETYGNLFALAAPTEDLHRIGLRSPEAIWARQLASQSTSFAIAGDGPVQSDVKPILEYAATKAFYKGGYADGIFLFDERVQQSAFAPAAKKKALRKIDDDLLLPIFSEFTSDNRDLMKYLARRSGTVEETEEIPASAFLPVIFRDSSPPDRSFASDPGSLESQLLHAEALIYGKPGRRDEGLKKLQMMRADLETTRPIPASMVAAIALEAKVRWVQDDFKGALETVERGLEFAPEEPQLNYLHRLLSHAPGSPE